MTRMERHHAPPTPAGVPALAELAESTTWAIDDGARGRRAAAPTQPGMLVRREGTAQATVTRSHRSGVALRALEAARMEHAE